MLLTRDICLSCTRSSPVSPYLTLLIPRLVRPRLAACTGVAGCFVALSRCWGRANGRPFSVHRKGRDGTAAHDWPDQRRPTSTPQTRCQGHAQRLWR